MKYMLYRKTVVGIYQILSMQIHIILVRMLVVIFCQIQTQQIVMVVNMSTSLNGIVVQIIMIMVVIKIIQHQVAVFQMHHI